MIDAALAERERQLKSLVAASELLDAFEVEWTWRTRKVWYSGHNLKVLR